MNTVQITQNYHNLVRGVEYQVMETYSDYLLLKNSPGTICIPTFLVDTDRRYAKDSPEEEEEYEGAI